ncbi:DNA-binding transcriptional regulator, AcrR family [Salinihabitans flavidus]|uniref:DNA-binding transcriptional regulator, AcrR family n=1 Tax=Salinihabitans flavidus TaxID=569882 RepID=A0A1H8W4E2_9RHOB|nr:TetR/AcrR family transcriptional regulator [Salinihabitans flavidus]SEP22327.1 DNA-binding transcriptional regulator, AcrR family [Salinihabitans flavidus]
MATTTNSERRGWTQNPDAVKRDILTVALSEFAANGLSGTRVDTIASRTRTSKRMIYYYFGDKLGLYTRALEAAYLKVREGEASLDLDHLQPKEALARLVAFTFDHHRKNPDFIRMVMIENIHNAEHLAASQVIRDLNVAAIEKLARICQGGQDQGVFREGLDPVAIHWQISAASFFNVSNRPTFSSIFGNELFEEEAQRRIRQQTVDSILAMVAKPEATG